MELTGEQLIPAPRTKVWDAINDPEILRQCITGAESVTKTSDTDFEATVQVKVGPVKARFKGKVSLGDLDPPNSCTISGEAQGGVAAGFGKGSAEVQLTDAPVGGGTGTKLTYAVKAQVGGKLAQIGARLIDGVAAKMADDFFSKFNALVGAPAADAGAAAQNAQGSESVPETAVGAAATTAAPQPAPLPAPVTGGIPSWAWIVGLIVIVGIVTAIVLRQ